MAKTSSTTSDQETQKLLDEMNQKIAELERENSRLVSNNTGLEKSNSDLSTVAETAGKEVNALRKRLVEAEDMGAGVSQEVYNQLVQENKDLRAANSTLSDRIDNLVEELEVAQNAVPDKAHEDSVPRARRVGFYLKKSIIYVSKLGTHLYKTDTPLSEEELEAIYSSFDSANWTREAIAARYLEEVK